MDIHFSGLFRMPDALRTRGTLFFEKWGCFYAGALSLPIRKIPADKSAFFREIIYEYTPLRKREQEVIRSCFSLGNAVRSNSLTTLLTA